MQKFPKQVVLVILDGWGYSKKKINNPTQLNQFDCIKNLYNYPNMLLNASGNSVGLPKGQIGNSEVGHLHIGAGRLVMQELTRINNEIKNKTFDKNDVLLNIIQKVKQNKKTLHIIGLLSKGGVHSHENHIIKVIQIANRIGVRNQSLHAILDGRDTSPHAGIDSIKKLKKLFEDLNCGNITSVSGRYYAMDRDNRWDRTEKFYKILTEKNNILTQKCPIKFIEDSYKNNLTDEFIPPTALSNNNIQNGDGIIFMNFRKDRMKQIAFSFLKENEKVGFVREIVPIIANSATLTAYDPSLSDIAMFKSINLKNTLGECVDTNNMKQLRIAETEKYAHVTYFFNGGKEKKFNNEERILIKSPQVATYDTTPAMMSYEITNQLIKAIQSKKYSFIVCNYANPDMVGHTGKESAAIEAVSSINKCLQSLINTTTKETNVDVIITADHGNIECMYDAKKNEPHTAHTTNPVPLFYITNSKKLNFKFKKGNLYDIAPTILKLLDITIPTEMTGNILFY